MTFDQLLARQSLNNPRMRPRDEEHQLQCACVNWFRLTHQDIGHLLFAVPNGGRRDKITGAKLKAEGVVAGVADLILLVPREWMHGLCIEMKTPSGRQSQQQKHWQNLVEKQGYRYIVCRSVTDFIEQVKDYLNEED